MDTLDLYPHEKTEGSVFVVTYSEDAWKGLPEANQQFCKEAWIKRATPIERIKTIALRLEPDRLFPMHGNNRPYIEWQHAIERVPECGYQLAVELTFTLNTPGMDVPTENRIRRELEKYPRGTEYVVLSLDGNAEMKGRT